MPNRVLNVLLIEDNPGDARLIREFLNSLKGENAAPRFVMEHADRLTTGLEWLDSKPFDVVLLDLSLPDSLGLDTLDRAVSVAGQVPIVVLTGLDDEDTGVRALKQGAQDYLVKGQVDSSLISRVIHYAIERKRAKLEMERQARRLEQSNRELSVFAYVVAHELKQPLTAISGIVDILKGCIRTPSPDADELTAKILSAVKWMETMIDSLLTYSRVETWGKSFEPTDCEKALAQAMANLEIPIGESEAEITHDPLPVLEADASQITELFQNLIGNAIKFHGDQPPVIHISAAKSNDNWLFYVRDNGIGMKPEDASQVFIMFKRAHDKLRYPGQGIGLAICKKIVERHHGTIWVKSEPDRGATFYFTIPAVQG